MKIKKLLIGLLRMAALGGINNIGQHVFTVEGDTSVIDILNKNKEINISPYSLLMKWCEK